MQSAFLFLTTLLLCSAADSPQSAQPSLRGMLLYHLPAHFAKMAPGKTTRQQLESALGKPHRISGNKSLYNLNGINYDTTFEFQGAVVKRVIFHPVAPSLRGLLSLPHLRPLIPEGALESAYKNLNSGPATHESGRKITVVLPQEGLTLIFRNSAEKPLDSVTLEAQP